MNHRVQRRLARTFIAVSAATLWAWPNLGAAGDIGNVLEGLPSVDTLVDHLSFESRDEDSFARARVRAISIGSGADQSTGEASEDDSVIAGEAPTVGLTAVTFAYDSAELTGPAQVVLERVAEALRTGDLSQDDFLILGHTDAAGSDTYNLGLSIRRADSVRNYLISNQGLETGRLRSVGLGKSDLIAGIDPLDGRNRRSSFSTSVRRGISKTTKQRRFVHRIPAERSRYTSSDMVTRDALPPDAVVSMDNDRSVQKRNR